MKKNEEKLIEEKKNKKGLKFYQTALIVSGALTLSAITATTVCTNLNKEDNSSTITFEVNQDRTLVLYEDVKIMYEEGKYKTVRVAVGCKLIDSIDGVDIYLKENLVDDYAMDILSNNQLLEDVQYMKSIGGTGICYTNVDKFICDQQTTVAIDKSFVKVM